MRIAVVGSRDYPHLDDVRALIQLIARDRPDATIISGGAQGVDTTAEQEARMAGLKVSSFRVRELKGQGYGVEEWAFGAQVPYVRLMMEGPFWEDPPVGSGAVSGYDACLMYRNSLIIERAERVVVFHDGFSRGTWLARDFAEGAKRPLKVYGVDSARFVKA